MTAPTTPTGALTDAHCEMIYDGLPLDDADGFIYSPRQRILLGIRAGLAAGQAHPQGQGEPHAQRQGQREPSYVRTELLRRMADYFTAGGLWNPEAMEHDKVRDLLRDCRAYLLDDAAQGQVSASVPRKVYPPGEHCLACGQSLACEASGGVDRLGTDAAPAPIPPAAEPVRTEEQSVEHIANVLRECAAPTPPAAEPVIGLRPDGTRLLNDAPPHAGQEPRPTTSELPVDPKLGVASTPSDALLRKLAVYADGELSDDIAELLWEARDAIQQLQAQLAAFVKVSISACKQNEADAARIEYWRGVVRVREQERTAAEAALDQALALLRELVHVDIHSPLSRKTSWDAARAFLASAKADERSDGQGAKT